MSGPGWHARAENGSNSLIDYVTSSSSDGAIGYDEYAYALNANAPVTQIPGHVAVPRLSKCEG